MHDSASVPPLSTIVYIPEMHRDSRKYMELITEKNTALRAWH